MTRAAARVPVEVDELRRAPDSDTLRRLLRQAIRRQGARNTWCRLNGITDPQNVSSFLSGKIERPPAKAYIALGFRAPNGFPVATLNKMRAALRRLNGHET